MRKTSLKFSKAIALAALVSFLSLAIITPRGAEPGPQLGLARQGSKGFELPSVAAIKNSGNTGPGLPPGAVIIEEQFLESENHPDRALLLWMQDPTRIPPRITQEDPDEIYTRPDRT